MYFIGIDIGTTSVKIIATDENGNIVRSISKEYPLSFPKPLWSQQNPEDWWRQSISGFKELLDGLDKSEVKAVSFSGQMHGMVTLDENDQVVRPAILWNDQRTEKECEYLNNEIGRNKISQWTGNVALTGFTAPKVLWLKGNEPENFAVAKKIMLPKDYIAYKMSGVFATDMSDASGTLYLDVKNRKWSAEMLELLGISEEQLPRLYESYEVIGNIKPDLAEELGLNKDVKIVIGGGDQAVAAVGGGVVGAGSCSLSLGTSGVVFTSNEEFFVDENNGLHSFCHANGKYHLMGVTLAAAASLKWWVEEVNKSEDFDGLLNEAKEAQIDDSLFYLPYLMGERTPHNDPNCRGTFIGINMTHERKHMTRAVLEGVAFSLRDTFEIMKEMGIEITDISISGGGAKSKLWCEIIADVLNVRVNKLNTNEGPAYGAAILASVGFGLFDRVEDACCKFIKVTESIHPDKENSQLYNKKYEKFRKIYPTVKDLFKQLI
ncbi:xylulose kinase XylB [Clostridium aceticum]|uniref:Xylulose kinase n=1 Tax=Clostridium aceticum TaxID=84022 RepID=A0A0D8IAR9_9CLOT|nr:xylulokinase [Clostridium aceticum]AKL95914.1 xylulose kinase XylB [Clostridium aceticum]KJF27132.1 xylulose kinase [Clostridium aceticum]